MIIIGGESVVTGARSSLEALAPDFGDIEQIGEQLFSNYVFALEVTAALLTIAVVGAVVLSRRPQDPLPLPEPEDLDDDEDEAVYTRSSPAEDAGWCEAYRDDNEVVYLRDCG